MGSHADERRPTQKVSIRMASASDKSANPAGFYIPQIIIGNNFNAIAGIFSKNSVEIFFCFKNLFCDDFNISCLTFCTAERLMNHNKTVGKSKSLALCT